MTERRDGPSPTRDAVLEEAAFHAEKKSVLPQDYTDQVEDFDYWRGYAKGREEAGMEVRTLKNAAPQATAGKDLPAPSVLAPMLEQPAAAAPSAPGVVVPLEPTEAMLWAAAKASKDCGMRYTVLQIRDIWRGMLNAAPSERNIK